MKPDNKKSGSHIQVLDNDFTRLIYRITRRRLDNDDSHQYLLMILSRQADIHWTPAGGGPLQVAWRGPAGTTQGADRATDTAAVHAVGNWEMRVRVLVRGEVVS
jgi:hypothetical protein